MVQINKEACIGCGKCVDDCISGCLLMDGGKAAYTGKCIHCGHCVAICPSGAVSIPEYDMADVQEYPLQDFGLDIGRLLGTIKFRRSIRHYTDQKVETEKLKNIIQAGRYTATGVNRQACRFVVVQDKLEILKSMVWIGVEQAVSTSEEAARELQRLIDLRRKKQIDYLFRNAPTVLYIAANNVVDAGLAAQNMELAAIAQGLGVLYNGYLARSTALSKEACDWLCLDGKPLAVCMLVGYPAVDYRRTAPRKKADAIWL